MKIIRFAITFMWLVFYWQYSNASHIVGGEITYTKQDSNKYEIKLVLFVDCINGNPDAISEDHYAGIGIFDANNNYIKTLFIERTGPTRIANASYTCIKPSSNACVDMYVYTKTIVLKDTAGGYILAYQRCCRNHTITNIMSPSVTGATYFTKIPDTTVTPHNSSARFKSLPPNFLCVDEIFEFDHSATDADGDSLVYGLYTPFEGAEPFFPRPVPPYAPPYNTIYWRNTYSAKFPFGTNAKLEIDSSTGKVTFLPKSLGQFVAGLVVKEYRKGIYIGETRRDYQFNILPCHIAMEANFTAPEIYCRKDLQFTNLGTADGFLWDFGVENSTTDTSTAVNPVFTFPANGTYKVWQLAISGNCVDSFSRTITIKDPEDYFFAIKDTAICFGDSVSLGTTSVNDGYTISWSPDKWLSNTTIPNPIAYPDETTTYYVTKSYQKCTFTDSVTIKVNYSKADFFWKQFSCKREVAFTNQGFGDNFLWDFGVENSNTDTSTTTHPVFTFPHAGTYKVKLVTTAGLCIDSIIKDITVYSLENYKLDINDTAICSGSSVNLGTDTSRAYKTTWLPDEWLNDNTLPNPLATPQETITYVVKKSFLDCVYTDSVKIIVNNPKAGFTAPDSVCHKQLAFANTGSADSFYWDFGLQNSESDTSTAKNPLFTFPANGTYKVLLRAKSGNCIDSFSREITIMDPESDILAKNDTAICIGQTVELGSANNNPGYSISWFPEKWLNDANIPNPIAKPLETITYKVTKTFKDCGSSDFVTIAVDNAEVELAYEIEQQCDRNDIVFSTLASDSVKYSWYINGRIVSTEANPVLSFPYGEKITGYLLTTASENCADTKPFEFDFPGFNNLPFYIPNIITPNNDGENECFGPIIKNYDIKCAQEMYIYNRWGELVFRNDKPCWDGTDSRNGKPLAEGTYFYILTIAGKTYNGTVTLLR